MFAVFIERFRKITAVTLVATIVFSFISPAFAATGGPSNSGTAVDLSGVGTITWTNPSNVNTSGSPYATAALGGGQTSHYLNSTNYGFTIPAGATIEGISVEVRRNSSANTLGLGVQDNVVKLVKGGVVIGSNKAVTGTTWGTSFSVVSYGGASDKWGTTWTPADINASNFGVVFSVLSNAILSRTATVDYIKVTVTYTTDSTAPVISQVTAVPSPTADTTPNYTFTTNEAGTITYGGDCSSVTTSAAVGSNTVTFNALAGGVHSNCTITVTDAATNISNTLAVNSFTIDTVAPVITRLGVDPVTVEVGSVYTDAGATATDAVDGDRTANIITVNPVNSNVVGVYTVTYNVVDTVGNIATTVTRTVNVVDTTIPVISLVGSATVSVNFGAIYTDAGATASDNYDGNITGSIVTVNPVNTGTLGNQTVTYDVTDANGNAAVQVTRTVTVVDVTSPVITITGANPMTVEVGGAYTELGAVADDDVDPDFAATPSGSVNTSVLGTYTITYNATDLSTNAAVAVTRTVNVVDTTIPVLTLLGITPTDAEWTQVYTDAGATASDNLDGDITASIITVNPVNTLVIGIYTVTYNVSDANGNDAVEVTRTVNVVDTTAPIAPVIGTPSVDAPIIHSTSTATGTCETGATVSITNVNLATNPTTVICSGGTFSVTLDWVGTGINPPQTLTFTQTDSSGNTSVGAAVSVGAAPQGGPGGGAPTPISGGGSTTTPTSASEPIPAPTPAPTPEPTPESTPTPTNNATENGDTHENFFPPVETPTPTPEPTPTPNPAPTPAPTGSTGGTTTGGTDTTTGGTAGTGGTFNPADANLDSGGGVTPETVEPVEETTPIDATLDIGGGVAVEETSYTLLWILLGILALLNGWWYFAAKNKKLPITHRNH